MASAGAVGVAVELVLEGRHASVERASELETAVASACQQGAVRCRVADLA